MYGTDEGASDRGVATRLALSVNNGKDARLRAPSTGKRGRRSAVLVPSVPYVNQWKPFHAGDSHDDPLWCRLNRPDQVSNNYIRDILKDRAWDADVERPVTPSNFRTSSASYLVSQGVSQAHLENHHGWSRGSDIAARYISVFQDANDREIARAHGVEVTEDEPDDLAPAVCPRCDKQTPHDEPACVWCGQARFHTATEVVEELKMQSSASGADRETVAERAAEESDLSIPEAQALVEDTIEAETMNEIGDGRLTA